MISLTFIKPLIKSLIKPWILFYAGVQLLALWYPSWFLWFLSQGILVYGAVERRKAYTYYPTKPEWFIHWFDIVLDMLIMYHECFVSALKMARMALPFLGNYQWIHKSDPRAQGASLNRPSQSVMSQILSRPAIQLSNPQTVASSTPRAASSAPQPRTPGPVLPSFQAPDVDDIFQESMSNETHEAAELNGRVDDVTRNENDDDDASESSGDFDQPGEHTMAASPSQAEIMSHRLADLVDKEEDFVKGVEEFRQVIECVQKSAEHKKEE